MACAVASARMAPAIRGCARIVRARPGDRSRFRLCPRESVSANMFLDRFDAAKRALQRAGARARSARRLRSATTSRMLEHDAGGHRSARGAIQGFVRPSSPAARAVAGRSLAPDSFGARGRSREKRFDAAEGRGLRETAAIYASAAAVWEAFSGNQSAARQRAVDRPGYVERPRRHVCRRLRAGARRGDHSIGSAGKRSRAPVSTRYPRQIHVCADAARARCSRAQPAGHGHRTAAGERPLRACCPRDGLQLLLWKPVSRLCPCASVCRQRTASAGGRGVSEDPRPSGD